MAKTLMEWAQRLDAAGVQVHQEGAIARFESAASADDYGRPSPAAAARKKTTAFYAEVLRRAVALKGAHSFTIPAAAAQGAFVAAHEALAAANEFTTAQKAFAAFTADPSRPELLAEAEKLKATLGRAASMHQTACAEAVSAANVAACGPWFRGVKNAEEVPVGPFVVGVEVWAGSPVLAKCHAVLDPQHGGGVYGFGRQPKGAIAACDAALSLRNQGVVLPEGARYVTTRVDPDALVASMILSGRIPLPMLGSCGQPIALQRLIELARIDSSEPSTDGWMPVRMVPQTVGDHPVWGPLAALLNKTNDIGEWECAVFAALTDVGYTALHYQCKAEHERQWKTAQNLKFEVDGQVAFASDLPVGAGTWAKCYSLAPVGVLSFVRPGTNQRAFTVAACRDLADVGPAFREAFERLANAQDGAGAWAGPGGITGSRKPTRLSLAEVVSLAKRACDEVGIRGAASMPAQTFALR